MKLRSKADPGNWSSYNIVDFMYLFILCDKGLF